MVFSAPIRLWGSTPHGIFELAFMLAECLDRRRRLLAPWERFAWACPYIVNVSLVWVLPDSYLLSASRPKLYKPHRAHPASFSTLSLSPASGTTLIPSYFSMRLHLCRTRC
ncbi:hypothetical protein BDN72DRAFT_842415 [Pluteus cervinus]|uniref:Uncharacterized protein n=1 Tax=Pluteus cervinus TaxID=181527 RepID=A0ACD3AQK3_9AGAR|nr:hypothetical protein BDN72DRAFT_842415 [Pluteus cervinus]